MIRVVVPGYRELSLQHVVLDYNGTLAQDGELLCGIQKILNTVADQFKLHIVTADTFGKVKLELKEAYCKLSILSSEYQAEEKLRYVRHLGSSRTIAIGNGRNDRLMVKEAALGIAVVGREGIATETLIAADIVCGNVLDALELLLNPKRIIATLRS